MQQTTNYQLCQWEAEDRILREDFNRDNLIIENGFEALKAALEAERRARDAEAAALRASISSLTGQVGLQTVRTVVTSAPAAYVEISLADVSWAAWRAVHLQVLPKMPGTRLMGVYLNGLTRDLIQTTGGQVRGWISFYPRYDPQMPVSGLALGSNSRLFSFSTLYRDFTKVALSTPEGTEDIPAGTEVRILGER